MNAGTFEPRGVIPACLMPFDADLNVDETAWGRTWPTSHPSTA